MKKKLIYWKAFTLIELLVVVSILAVAAAAVLIAIDPIKKIQAAKDATVKSDISQLANALQVHYADPKNKFEYPTSLEALITSDELKALPKQQSGAFDCKTGEKTTTAQPYCYETTGGRATVWGTTWGNDTSKLRRYYWHWDSVAGKSEYAVTLPEVLPKADDELTVWWPSPTPTPTHASTPTPTYIIITPTPTHASTPTPTYIIITPTPTPTPTRITTYMPTPSDRVCTMDMKLCPDGKTWVGRAGSNCEFAPCP